MTWIKRTTGLVEKELKKANIEDWVKQQRRSYWRWAGHVTCMTDNRWTVRILSWVPQGGSRRAGRPSKTWIDELRLFIADVVDDAHAQRQVDFMLTHAGHATRSSDHKKEMSKRRRVWKTFEDQFVAQEGK